jgi:predicted Fe-Mo cluster-binding NifX family protein/ferredoxin
MVMKVAVTATEPSLDAQLDPRFGRCPFFVIVDTDTLQFEALENPNLMLGGGAGIQSARLMSEKGVQHILTGNCGPNAYQTLSAAGVGVIIGGSGTVANAVEQFKAGQLTAAGEPNVASKFGVGGSPTPGPGQPAGPQQSPMMGGGAGMGRGGGRGMGGGMGRGMGQGGGMGGGMGRGMGRGRGMGAGGGQGMGPRSPQAPVSTPQQSPQGPTREEELAMLKQQAEAIGQQMQQIQERIGQLSQQNTGSPVAKVDPENCTRCGACVDVCPFGAISLDDDKAVVDEGACTGCGLCVGECPREAIQLG